MITTHGLEPLQLTTSSSSLVTAVLVVVLDRLNQAEAIKTTSPAD